MAYVSRLGIAVVTCSVASTLGCPTATADNSRLNSSVIANVNALQHQAGCTSEINRTGALTRAAQLHALDLLHNRSLDGDLGSDGSTPQSRSAAAGFRGVVAQTVAINPALAINNLEVLRQWYYDPVAYAIMSNCANTVIGVWSENSFDRSVVVAVFGQPD
jgi:uncharacterized protein YkwD